MQSKATTVAQYLQELPDDRRAAVEAVRKVIRANLDRDIEEGMQYGMIGYYVPHRVFPPGYHCDPRQPLPYACLASQKHHLSLYLMSAYAEGTPEEGWFRQAWAKSGKKLDMGKCCIRFKRAEDLALDVIAEAFRRTNAKQHVAHYTSVIDARTRKPRPEVSAARKAAAKPAATKTAKKTATKTKKKTATKSLKRTAKKTAKPAARRAARPVAKQR